MNTKLIEILGGGTKECDCSGYPRHDSWCAKISKPILLGTVMNKIFKKGWKTLSLSESGNPDLIELWSACGKDALERSLQDILSDVEEVCDRCKLELDGDINKCGCIENYEPVILTKQLKPESKALEDFLNTIFNE